jgi:hypothetical protein
MAGGTGIAQRDSPAWVRVRTMPGITQRGMQRFHLPHAIGGANQLADASAGGRHA